MEMTQTTGQATPAAETPVAPAPVGPEGLTIDQAMARAEAQLFPESNRPRDANGRFLSQTEPAPAEAMVETGDLIQPEEGEVAEVEVAEEAPADTLTWDEVKDIKLNVKVKTEGGADEEREATLDELRAGYMMQADYQRKTAELAKQRAQVEEQATKRVSETQQEYVQRLAALERLVQQVAAPELQGVDWNRLAEEDPAHFVRMSNKARQITEAQRAVQAQIQEETQRFQQEQQQRVAQAIAQGREQLQKDIPGFGDDLANKLVDFGAKTYGYSREEVASVIDPRMVKVLHDAFQWRDLQTKKPAVEARVAQVPKVVKPGTRVTASAQQSEKINALRQRLKSTGKIEDAMAYLEASQTRR